jgi:hypothetical protein
MTFPVPSVGLTRRELLKGCAKAALALPAGNVLATMRFCGGKSVGPPSALPASDDEFLDQIERAAFRFFWEQASPLTGQVKDRALAAGNDSRAISSIASSGFGLTALCIGHQRGYGDAPQIQARVGTSELSSIDTAILLCGVLTCRQYFQDAHIQNVASQIYNRVDWPWMLNGGAAFSMGWAPEGGFLSGRWDTYSEPMMIYLLAIGSTTHPVPASCWDAFARPAFTYQGLSYITNLNAPLFIHQYSHAWFDFRNQRDKYANYFDNSVIATRAHKQFCLSLKKQYPDYQENLWGITSSDSAHGYVAWGGPPQMGSIDGSIVPCASGGSLPFAPSDCIAVLRNIRSQYPLAWQRYGYVDAFNPINNWYDPDVIGIDVGITMLMAENQRTNFVWNTFMRNPEAQSAFARVFGGRSGKSAKLQKASENR